MPDAQEARKPAGRGQRGRARHDISRKAGFLAAAGLLVNVVQMALPVILVRLLTKQEFGDYRQWLVATTGLILFLVSQTPGEQRKVLQMECQPNLNSRRFRHLNRCTARGAHGGFCARRWQPLPHPSMCSSIYLAEGGTAGLLCPLYVHGGPCQPLPIALPT
jgi:hypothetical protein